ncbi:hypothetical protein HDV04_006000 [Boothiomyces sp. JEL0838]|nr:hypothetical protein HDV04_006000 [Boothiomyces sp. JEL0838]
MLLVQKHIEYIQSLDTNNDLQSHLSNHLRLNGIYWATTCLYLLDSIHLFDKNQVIKQVMECLKEDGGFAGYPTHDSHLLFTLSAIQILAIYDSLDLIQEKTIQFILDLQKEDGSVAGDKYGETDTRFIYCAVSALSILGCLERLNTDRITEYLVKCQNFDGGFGSVINAESHAGQIFCAVGALKIMNNLHLVDCDQLGWWLSERQLDSGGLNGRPEKLPDVCYSWWVLSSLEMIDRVWIDLDKLSGFILRCQDENGGISDREGNMVDVFHTLFGVCGLSFCGYEGLLAVDPRYCLPLEVTQRLGL